MKVFHAAAHNNTLRYGENTYEYSLVQKKNISIFQTLPAEKPYFYDYDYFHAAKVLNSVMPSYVMGDWKNLKPVFRNSDSLSTHTFRSNSPIPQTTFFKPLKTINKPNISSFHQELFKASLKGEGELSEQSSIMFANSSPLLVYWCAVAQIPCQ